MKNHVLINYRKFLLILFWIFASFQMLMAQSGTVKGFVYDEKGNTLPGVNIVVEGTTIGVSTGNSGSYQINFVPLGEQKLTASFIGFQPNTKVVTVVEGKTNEINLTLKEDAISLLEVEVTASKRSQRIKDVPMSISAISGKQLEMKGISNANDYLESLPGVRIISNNPTTTGVTIRGVAPLGGWSSPVGYYIDETPVTEAGWNPASSSFDVDRIEVLRGPQGTLYGEASMGGTIKIITNKPNVNQYQFKFDPELSFTDGGGSNYIANGMINIPVIKNKLAVRATGFYQNDAAYISNVGFGGEKTNTYNTYGGRFSARYIASEKLSFTASAIYNKSNVGDFFAANENMEQTSGVENPTDDRYSIYNLNTFYDLSFANLTITGSYYTRETDQVWDLVGLLPVINTVLGFGGIEPRTMAYMDRWFYTDAYTAEARLVSSTTGPFKWTAGLFYKDYNRDFGFDAKVDPIIDDATIDALGQAFTGVSGIKGMQRTVDSYKIKQVAAFGELSYDITNKLNFLAGLRLFHVNRDILTTNDGLFGTLASGLPPADYADKGDETILNPKFVITYKATNNLMSYFNVSKGFRDGGQNVYTFLYPDVTETSYKSESLWNYELGLKSGFFDGKLNANLAFYYNKWNDMQVITRNISNLPLTENIASAHTKGVDAEVNIMPTKGLLFSFSGNYTDAKTDVVFQIPTYVDPVEGEQFATVPAGHQLPSIPKYSFDMAAQYMFALTKATNAMLRVDYNYTDKRTDPVPDILNGFELPAYSVVNLRASVNYKWLEGYVFVNNVANTLIKSAWFYNDPNLGDIYFVGRPRTIGVGLRTSF